MTLKELKALVAEQFLFADDMVEAIYAGKSTQQAVLFYGEGGHAKTNLAQTVGQLLYKPEETRVVLYGRGTIPSSILGGVDFKKFRDDGILLYTPDKSWMSKKYVVSDEFLDAPKPVVEQLKYIMSEKEFPLADGSTYELKTETHIGCTNYEPDDWAETASDRALLGRFPIKLKVEWPNYSASNFSTLLEKRVGPDLHAIAEAAELCRESGVLITPRDVVYIAKQYQVMQTMNVFRFYTGVAKDGALLEQIIRTEHKAKYRNGVRKILKAVEENLKVMPRPDKTNLEPNQKMLAILEAYESTLKGIRTDDATISSVNSGLSSVRDRISKYRAAASAATNLTAGDLSKFELPAIDGTPKAV